MEISSKKYFKINTRVKKPELFLGLSKLFFTLFLFYYGWFQMVFFRVSNMSLLLGAGMMTFILFHFLIYKTSILKAVSLELLLWVIFVITSFSTGVFVAVNLANLTGLLMVFTQHLIMIFGMIYISLQDNRIDYFINNYILFSLVCAITTIYQGVYVFSDRISMSATTNPNTLGIIMVIGIFCILYKLDLNKMISTSLEFGALFLFFYVIVLSGSRKSFLSAVILLTFWFIFVRKDVFEMIKDNRSIKRSLFALILIIGSLGIYIFVFNSDIFFRLQILFESGNETRFRMYRTAVDLFKSSPLIGIGFNNYRAVTPFATYSHSTYAEVLACTGLIGTIIYFIPYITLTKKTWSLTKRRDIYIAKDAKLMICVLVMMLFLGTGVIHFYEVNSSITFGFIMAFCSLNYKSQKV